MAAEAAVTAPVDLPCMTSYLAGMTDHLPMTDWTSALPFAVDGNTEAVGVGSGRSKSGAQSWRDSFKVSESRAACASKTGASGCPSPGARKRGSGETSGTAPVEQPHAGTGVWAEGGL